MSSRDLDLLIPIGTAVAIGIAMIALAIAAALEPEPACRTLCIKDHTELRVFMRPDYSGSGALVSDVLPASVCDEYQEVCPPDAAVEPGDDLSTLQRRAPLLDDDAMAERIKRAADRDDARSVERRCGKNFGADRNGMPRRMTAHASSPQIGGNP